MHISKMISDAQDAFSKNTPAAKKNFSVHYTQNIIHEIPLPVSVNRQGDERIRLFYFVPLHLLETIMIRISPITSIPIKIRYGMV